MIKIYEEFITDRLQSDFISLKKKWIESASLHSNPSLLYGDENYQEIISMGEKIIPILIRDLNTNDGDWIRALNEITGINPIKESNIGYMEKMIQDWREWYDREIQESIS